MNSKYIEVRRLKNRLKSWIYPSASFKYKQEANQVGNKRHRDAGASASRVTHRLTRKSVRSLYWAKKASLSRAAVRQRRKKNRSFRASTTMRGFISTRNRTELCSLPIAIRYVSRARRFLESWLPKQMILQETTTCSSSFAFPPWMWDRTLLWEFDRRLVVKFLRRSCR